MNLDVIKPQLKELLKKRGKSLYWLQKQTGLTYITLMKIRDNRTSAIDYRVLSAICTALDCGPGEFLQYIPDKKKRGAAK
jgi:putative transcriptional regulator